VASKSNLGYVEEADPPRSPHEQSRSRYRDIVAAVDRECQCIVFFGENCLHQPLLRLPLRFDPRLGIDLE